MIFFDAVWLPYVLRPVRLKFVLVEEVRTWDHCSTLRSSLLPAVLATIFIGPD